MLIKLLSTLLAGLLVFEPMALAVGSNLISSVTPIVQTNAPMLSRFVDPIELVIPREYADINAYHQGSNGKVIIHIQDPHSNFDGQWNLSKTIADLVARYNIELILVEGANGDVSLNELSPTASKAEWARVSKKLLFDGIISGEEHYSLKPDSDLEVWGIEDSTLHKEQIQIYREMIKNREAVTDYLNQCLKNVDWLKYRLYSKDLLELERLRREFRKQSDQSIGWLDTLLDFEQQHHVISSLDSFGAIKKYIAIDQAQTDYEALDTQYLKHPKILELLERIQKEGAITDMAHLGIMSEVAKYHKDIQSLLVSEVASEFEPNEKIVLEKMANYYALLSGFDVTELARQIQAFENQIISLLLKDERSQTLHSIDLYLQLLKNAYAFRLSTQDLEILKKNAPHYKTQQWQAFLNDLNYEFQNTFEPLVYSTELDDVLPLVFKFYEQVGKRDLGMINNIDQVMAQTQAKSAIYIAGGYHTENMTELLRQRNYSYWVLAPRVEAETDIARYETILLDDFQQDITIHSNNALAMHVRPLAARLAGIDTRLNSLSRSGASRPYLNAFFEAPSRLSILKNWRSQPEDLEQALYKLRAKRNRVITKPLSKTQVDSASRLSTLIGKDQQKSFAVARHTPGQHIRIRIGVAKADDEGIPWFIAFDPIRNEYYMSLDAGYKGPANVGGQKTALFF